ncbi:twin-arginine translocase subunit TatC [Myxococcota bacterium]|nr:twin-arginine translocase subunit TatC [Myxococcota bacterium]
MSPMPEPTESMPRKSLREHLQELAYRIKLALLWMAGGTVIAFVFREWIMEWLMVPLAPALGADPKLHFSSPIEPFFTYMRLALQAGLFIAFPGLLWQLWSFIGPGLHRKERRFVLAITFWGVLFFLSGVAFAYYLVFPYGFDWLLNFARGETLTSPYFVQLQKNLTLAYGPEARLALAGGLVLEPTIMMDGYLKLIMSLLFAFGVMFELPLVIYFLAVSRVASISGLMHFFRYFVVIAFIVAAVLTPPDVITQIMLGVPLVLMYLMSVGVAALVLRGKKS